MKLFYALVIFVMIVCVSAFSAETTVDRAVAPQAPAPPEIKASILGKRKAKTKSDKTIVGIEKIVVTFINDGRDISDSNVQKFILQRVCSAYPINENLKLEEINLAIIERKAELEAKIKYPFTREELRDKYKTEADQKFVQQPLNSKLTVRYQQGPNIYKVSGIYYGFTFDCDGIRVGKTIVPLIDLMSEDKVKFDARYRERRKQEYINQSIAGDLAMREEYVAGRVKETVDSILKNDEDAGYILAWNKWRTPEEVAKIIIKYYSQ